LISRRIIMAEELEPASVDHVTGTAVGMVAGGVIVSALVAVGGVVAAPFTAGASLLAVPAAVIGMGLGGWWGYSNADKKAARYGVKRGR
jgi:hypothetical protein